MARVADVVDAVIGVDTHAQTHHVQLVDPRGGLLASCQVSNDQAGYRRVLELIAGQGAQARVIAGLEGTRSYGVGLARALTAAGITVVEVEAPSRRDRRGHGKSDPIDAARAARWLLGQDPARLATPRADGDREALRILLGAHRAITTTRTGHVNALRALLRGGEDTDRALASGTLTLDRLTRIARRRGQPHESIERAVRRAEARRLAIAIRDADQQLRAHRRQLSALIDQLAPGLTDQPGVGPISAAQLIISFSHPGRCRNEAAFAALAGTNPLPASSGKTIRHRLNRGGDRQLNRALHDVTLTRIRHDPTTQAYVARRTREGKTLPEIRRALKRYIARQQYRRLTTTMT
jgi:transposase